MDNSWAHPVEKVLRDFDVSIEHGLSDEEAVLRQQKYGKNCLTSKDGLFPLSLSLPSSLFLPFLLFSRLLVILFDPALQCFPLSPVRKGLTESVNVM